MSRHHDDAPQRHDDDAGLARADLDAVKRALAESRPDSPPAQAFTRQADDIMAMIAGASAPATATEAQPAASRPVREAQPQRASWLEGLRTWWQNLGRGEVLAYAVMLAVLVGGLWAASSLLETQELEGTSQPTSESIAEVPRDTTPDVETVLADADLNDDSELLGEELAAMSEESLEALAELTDDEWSLDDEEDWSTLARDDEETVTVATAVGADLDVAELARLDRALSADRSLFPH